MKTIYSNQMNGINTILFFFFSVLLFNNNPAIAQKGLIAHWQYDDEGITTAEAVSNRLNTIDYVFNEAKFKPSTYAIRRTGISGKALVFDGFSIKIVRNADDFNTPSEAITISVWIAPRAFEHGDGNKLSAIVNQQNLTSKKGFALGMFRHGRWSFQFGDGNSWVEVWDNEHPIPVSQWSFLTATYDANKKTAAIYLNGELVSEKKLSVPIKIAPAKQDFIIGQHNQPETIDRTFKLNMFNGLMDELKI